MLNCLFTFILAEIFFCLYGRRRAFSILVSEVQNEQGIFNVLRSLEVSLRILVTRLGSLFEILVAREQIVGASGDWAPINRQQS